MSILFTRSVQLLQPQNSAQAPGLPLPIEMVAGKKPGTLEILLIPASHFGTAN
jgi:hypothetical protein